jgi:hypothetical protein
VINIFSRPIIAHTGHTNGFIDWPVSWAKQSFGYYWSNDRSWLTGVIQHIPVMFHTKKSTE